MSRLKILLFIFVVTLAGAVIAGTYWVYTRVMGHDQVVQKEIRQLEGRKSAPPDPGLKRFDHAVEVLKSGDLTAAHDAFYDLLWHFPESAKAREARRIVGEMNMDALFSHDLGGDKKEYTVQPRDALNLIAKKNQMTVACLLRANGMMSTMLQPGDHLMVFPLDFEILVSIGAKTLTLLHNDRFFKDYAVLEVRMLPGMRIPAATGKLELPIKEEAAWVEGKRVVPTDPRFNDADKWLITSKVGFNIRSLPQAKAINPDQTTIEPHKLALTPTGGSKKGAPKPPKAVKKPKPAPKSVAAADEDTDDATAGVPETGVFLAREDMEELYTLIRTGTRMTLVR